MNKIIAVSFILQVTVGSILSFDSEKICLKKNIHFGKFNDQNKYMINEAKQKCSDGTNSVDCGHDHCAVNKEVCTDFIQDTLVYNIFKSRSIFFKDYSNIERKLQEVKSCGYTFSLNDICKNSLKCFQRFSGTLEYKNIRVMVQVRCKCRSDFSYHCGESYCAVHKEACEYFQALHNQTQLDYPKICGNLVII